MKKIDFEKNYGYKSYFINDTYMKKLYNGYIHKSFFDKLIDVLVLISIIFIIMSLILEFTMNLNSKIILIIESISIFALAIFSIELYRDYLKSKTTKEFFSNHYLDFILIVFLSFYFLFISLLGFLKILKIDFIKNIFSRIKHLKIIYNHIKKMIKNKLKN